MISKSMIIGKKKCSNLLMYGNINVSYEKTSN